MPRRRTPGNLKLIMENSENTREVLSKPIVIALSKSKLIAMTTGAAVAVAIGVWMLNQSAEEIAAHGIFKSPGLVHGISLVGIIFFGLCGIVGVLRLLDTSPGIRLDSGGLTDNSSPFSIGFVPWSEITGMEVRRIGSQRILYLLLKSPESVLAQARPWKRKVLKASLLLGPSPIAISSNVLSIGFDELRELINARLIMFHAD